MSDLVFTTMACRWKLLRQLHLQIQDSLTHRIVDKDLTVGIFHYNRKLNISWDVLDANIWFEPEPLPLETHEEGSGIHEKLDSRENNMVRFKHARKLHERCYC